MAASNGWKTLQVLLAQNENNVETVVEDPSRATLAREVSPTVCAARLNGRALLRCGTSPLVIVQAPRRWTLQSSVSNLTLVKLHAAKR